MKCIYNFQLTEETMVSVPFHNRAFQYGDGLFETMRFQEGRILFLEDHLERLSAGLEVLQMKLPSDFSLYYLETAIAQLVEANDLFPRARIRLQVWRKSGGLYTPTQKEAEFYISAQPFVETPMEKEKVLFYRDIRLQYSPLSSLKTCNALPYIMAGIAKTNTDADDMILLDNQGHTSECIASNIFWIKNGIVYTPSLQSGCIAGVMRKQIMNHANKLAIPLEEGLFPESSILEAEAVFCSNISGIQAIKQIEEVVFDAAKLPQALMTIGQYTG
ncbi:aminotransferase class IV [Rhodocytophaga rosea]|uniref:branched-chain-amino-acid transaminase n=1 Tax=Rhodocytophaga rosea TaxID=2704465 RepID=A0A6C0GN55_9BACT|nr:aminotransferase class IV [Rhodocytophaga rosea]QHT69466.1 aminotransferase class IV [Rhodocytophaga rosea]